MKELFLALASFFIGGVRNLTASLLFSPLGYSQLIFSNLLLSVNSVLDGGANTTLQKITARGKEREDGIIALRLIVMCGFFLSTTGSLILFPHFRESYAVGFVTFALSLPLQTLLALQNSRLLGKNHNRLVQKTQLIFSVTNLLSLIVLFKFFSVWALSFSTCVSFTLSLAYILRMSNRLSLGTVANPFRVLKNVNLLKISFGEVRESSWNLGVQICTISFAYIEVIIALFLKQPMLISSFGLLLNFSLFISLLPTVLAQNTAGKIITLATDDTKSAHSIVLILRRNRRLILICHAFILCVLLCFYYFLNDNLWADYMWFWPLFPIVIFSSAVYSYTFYSSSFFVAFDRQSNVLRIYVHSVAIGLSSFFIIMQFSNKLFISFCACIVSKSISYFILHTRALYRYMNK